jgi:hypothetical protein
VNAAVAWGLFVLGVVVVGATFRRMGAYVERYPSVMDDLTIPWAQKKAIKRAIVGHGVLPEDPELRQIAITWVHQESFRAPLTFPAQLLNFVGFLLVLSPIYVIPGAFQIALWVQVIFGAVAAFASWINFRTTGKCQVLAAEYTDPAGNSLAGRLKS